ncbi:helix-turn-helix domain-containing protein [Flavobacterium sp. KACC 22763]|uniref:helix-turn-helix domain-containing protein n=1 Tax=Flavobacterium sp. KACC 22763 TaxID=3025668 RepID=UPI002365966F|nr:XRE family transcriptional regulator [Flavobacterium sp. KACC 22763]WDF65993.1 XRE family transcriptional regulator [Flavobacterium sp. KACC 22763]
MEDFLIGIGKRLKEIRKKNALTIHEVASRANVSNGLVSRIENGRTIPSLPVLIELIHSLDTDVTYFFEGVKNIKNAKYIHIKKEDYQKIEKEDRSETKGFNYYHIFSKSINSIGFEAVILEVEPNSKREKVITDAWEFKYIIKGSVTYIIDDAEVLVNEGDSICFNGRLPHVPENRTQENCVMLVLYFYSESNS